MKRINIYLSEAQDNKLKELATVTDIKFAEHVRRAIDLYLETEKKKQEQSSKK